MERNRKKQKETGRNWNKGRKKAKRNKKQFEETEATGRNREVTEF